MKSFVIYNITNHYAHLFNQNMENKEHKAQLNNFLSENVNGTDHLGQLGENGRISLGENGHRIHRNQHMVP
jgi:uncharacterized protein YqiB (DUF1249 family)